jgi:hypothetical protein
VQSVSKGSLSRKESIVSADEVEVYQPRDRSQTKLELWADDLKAAYGVAVRLVQTSFVPDAYKGKPEEAAAAIMTGQEIGLSPLASLRSIDIINGTPGMRAIALRALVQNHGHEIWIMEQNQSRAIVHGRRRGSDKVEVSVWDKDRADKMNLSGKTNYKTQPGVMYVARATSEVARLIDADGIMGIPYSTEELMDLGEVEVTSSEGEVKPAKRAMRRKTLPEPGEVVDPPLPETVEVVVSPEVAAAVKAGNLEATYGGGGAVAIVSSKGKGTQIFPTLDERDTPETPTTATGTFGPVVTWETAPIPTGDSEEIVEPEINWENENG